MTQALFVLLNVVTALPGAAQDWSIPVGGNTFPDADGGRRSLIGRDGVVRLGGPNEACSVYFHVDRGAALTLSISARRVRGSSPIEVRVDETVFHPVVDEGDFAVIELGTVEWKQAGYVRLQFRSTQGENGPVEIRDVLVSSAQPDLDVTCVKSNEGNMFYWGRRGPSVHLNYQTPPGRDIRYAYSEIEVPEGLDPIGSYFMANGFGEGYFGMQVNSASERRVLFSVWSPFKTDDPREIPPDQQIRCLAKGPGVHVGEFGNEGSGGQSYLVYQWKPGKTYRFLTEVKPQGDGTTVYRSWFGDKAADEWRLIAAFRRPQTDTHLTRFHSFLENFSPRTGQLTRRGNFGNVWVADVEGVWHECTVARFSVDATGRGRHRLDFTGGADGDRFYMKNCGFFTGAIPAGTELTRGSSGTSPPAIDWDRLPGGE